METHRANGFPVFIPDSAEDWRKHLELNHDSHANTWLALYKKGSGRPSLS